jgi:hypothetical protein
MERAWTYDETSIIANLLLIASCDRKFTNQLLKCEFQMLISIQKNDLVDERVNDLRC